MILVVCVDDNNGIMFNKRRVSKDALLIERLMEIIGNNKLYVSNYSKDLFNNYKNVITDYNLLGENDYYFLEDEEIKENVFDKIIIYKWNRKYPADTYFEYSLKNYNLISSHDFKGNSHEKITEHIYTKEK